MKKLIAIVLSLVMVLSLCVACGGNPSGGQSGSEAGSDEQIKLEIGLPTNARVLSYEENALTSWLEEQTGYDLTFQPYSGGSDIATQISTTVAAEQPLPDILFGISLSDEAIERYGRDGYFVDLSEYFADREGLAKPFWDRLEENFTEYEQEQILLKITDPDTGGIYSIPSIEVSMVDSIDYQMWINTQWLDYLNLEMPTDRDSLLTVLRAFKTQDPNGNGKTDELPLFGAEVGMGSDVINWLVNMFLYFDDRKVFNVDEEGQLYAPFTTDDYRDALKFINQLMDEGLMLDSVFTTKTTEVKMITTPASGVANCGIFAGHLTVHTIQDNPILYQYEPLPLWSRAVINDYSVLRQCFITDSCENPEAAFKLFMTMWSEEGSRRIRYGEYKVNWDDADEGAVSDMGIPAEYKLLRDPLTEQNTCMWSNAGGTLTVYAEGESAQLTSQQSEWMLYKSKAHAQSRANYDAAAAEFNPPEELICPNLAFTEEEEEEIKAQKKACDSYFKKSRTDFCKGDLDPESDADWNAYLDTLYDLGLEDWLSMAQMAYERQQ